MSFRSETGVSPRTSTKENRQTEQRVATAWRNDVNFDGLTGHCGRVGDHAVPRQANGLTSSPSPPAHAPGHDSHNRQGRIDIGGLRENCGKIAENLWKLRF